MLIAIITLALILIILSVVVMNKELVAEYLPELILFDGVYYNLDFMKPSDYFEGKSL